MLANPIVKLHNANWLPLACQGQKKNQVRTVDVPKILVIVQICALNSELFQAFTIKPNTSHILQC